MASSVVQICNLALAELGERSITDLADGTTQANLCTVHYAPARDYVLADYPWTFALKRSAPTRLADTPSWEWGYAFQLPADCLRILRTNIDEYVDDPNTRWVVEGRQILCNETSLNIQYIASITDPVQFSTHFVTALSKYLAAQIAYPLTNSRALAQSKLQEYQYFLEGAKEVDGQIGNGLFSEVEVSTLTSIRR